jgi:hypothetical protein
MGMAVCLPYTEFVFEAERFASEPTPATPAPRPVPWRRATILVLIAVLLAGAIVTTSLSLGGYCLTTDTLDTRALRPPTAPPSHGAR